MAVVFEDNDDGTYDLKVDGRIREYDVPAHDLKGALSRARLDRSRPVYVEDATGYRQRLGR